MANAAADRFLMNLIAISCRRFKPEASQAELYRSKLRKWYLTQEQWASAMSRIAAEYTEEGLPALAVIYGYLKSVESHQHSPGCIALLFRVNGLCYVLAKKSPDGKDRIVPVDPANLPDLPARATDIHVVIPQEIQYPDDERDHGRQMDDLVESVVR